MLVLIDGRTVYTPLFSGVFWEVQDLLLADIERIEIISGPAATLWGANGVNGVINITTYSSAKTQGDLVRAGGGNREAGVAARHGGAIGDDGRYRVYVRYWDADHQRLATGEAIRDESRRTIGGFRADWERPAGSFTFQGDAYRAEIDQAPAARVASGFNVLGRWNRELGADSSMRLQVYYDRTDRDQPGTFKDALDILDVDFQHALRPADAHNLVWGATYRYAHDRVENTPTLAFIPMRRDLRWTSVFAQDEITLAPRLQLTLGLKAENNSYTGTEWLPTARVSWQATPDHFIWTALSRAVRAPSRIDRDLFFPGTPPFALVANDTFKSEVARVAEVGYRAQLSRNLSISATAFHHDYSNLRSVGLAGSSAIFKNEFEGRTDGIEAWAIYRVAQAWRLTGGFVALRESFSVVPGGADLGPTILSVNDPKRTALLRSSWDISPRHELDIVGRYVSALPDPFVPAYTAVDARFAWRAMAALEVSLAVRNAFGSHAEWGDPTQRAELDRAFFLQLQWKP